MQNTVENTRTCDFQIQSKMHLLVSLLRLHTFYNNTLLLDVFLLRYFSDSSKYCVFLSSRKHVRQGSHAVGARPVGHAKKTRKPDGMDRRPRSVQEEAEGHPSQFLTIFNKARLKFD